MADYRSATQPPPTASAPVDDYIKLRFAVRLVHSRALQIGPGSARTPYTWAAAGRVLPQLTAAGLVRFTPSSVVAGLPPVLGRYDALVPNSVLTELAHRIAVRIEAAEGVVAA